MIQDQITALAREYAEEKGKNLETTGELPICLIKEVVEMDAKEQAQFLQWLTRRYCLVEKRTVTELLKQHHDEAKGTDKGGREWFFYKGRLDLLKSLFPELGKEVES